MTNYVALKAELLVGHPDTGVYDADDQLAADQLNLVNRTRNRATISGKAVKEAFDGEAAEWTAILAEGRAEVLSLVSRDDLDPFGVDALMFQQAIGANAPNALAALVAYRVENVSRGVELGFGIVSAAEVDSARRATA